MSIIFLGAPLTLDNRFRKGDIVIGLVLDYAGCSPRRMLVAASSSSFHTTLTTVVLVFLCLKSARLGLTAGGGRTRTRGPIQPL